MNVALLIETFPKLSESFILNQITALTDKKINLSIFASAKEKGPVNEYYTKYNLNRITHYEPDVLSAGKAKRILRFIYLVVKLLAKKPLLFNKLFFLEGRFFNKRYFYAVFPFLENRGEFDIVHAHFGPVGVRACVLQRLGVLKGKVICSFHGYDVDRKDFRENPSYYEELFRTASLITANSWYTLGKIKELGCPERKLVVLPESLRTEYFKRNEIVGGKKSIKIITVARLVEFKGIKYGLQSVAELIKRGITEFNYVIVGDGELREQLKALAIQLGLENHVTFLGAKTQEFILKEMSTADVFLLTGIIAPDGRQENQGLVLQEAQAMQLPVVTSRVGGVSEGVLNTVSGFLEEEKQPIFVADKLQLLIRDYELRKKMGDAGRNFVVQHFDSAVLADKLISLYKMIGTG